MMIKLLINKRLVAIVSTYVQVQGLAEDVKDNSYEDLISHVSKVGENELVILGGDSIVKRISGYISRQIENCRVYVKGFPGAKTECMKKTMLNQHQEKTNTN